MYILRKIAKIATKRGTKEKSNPHLLVIPKSPTNPKFCLVSRKRFQKERTKAPITTLSFHNGVGGDPWSPHAYGKDNIDLQDRIPTS